MLVNNFLKISANLLEVFIGTLALDVVEEQRGFGCTRFVVSQLESMRFPFQIPRFVQISSSGMTFLGKVPKALEDLVLTVGEGSRYGSWNEEHLRLDFGVSEDARNDFLLKGAGVSGLLLIWMADVAGPRGCVGVKCLIMPFTSYFRRFLMKFISARLVLFVAGPPMVSSQSNCWLQTVYNSISIMCGTRLFIIYTHNSVAPN